MCFTLVASSFLRLKLGNQGARDLAQVLPFIAQCLGVASAAVR
jgi:hypothetical protein